MTALFAQALTSSRKSDLIPDHPDLFAGLLGHWDFIWVDGVGTAKERHVPGEWLFSRVLDGTGVQDVFICPARGAREHSAQPDGEYGTTLRIYNPRTLKWDFFTAARGCGAPGGLPGGGGSCAHRGDHRRHAVCVFGYSRRRLYLDQAPV